MDVNLGTEYRNYRWIPARIATSWANHALIERQAWPADLRRCDMGQTCHACVKYLMFTFNLVFWLCGCGILGVGIWLSVTQGNFATLSPSFPSLSAANVLIAAGTIVMVIGFLGCLGSIKENRCLLVSFFFGILLVFLMEVTAGILFVTYTEQINAHAKEDLKEGLALYGSQGNLGLTKAWNIIQIDFHCCGVLNHTDWFMAFGEKRVPDSCCFEYSRNCGMDRPKMWWPLGCYDKVKGWILENLVMLGIFALLVLLVQILSMVFSLTVCLRARKGKKNMYV
uniref:tetraspanin-4-like isoform X2 n=1 Tax=Myxine glutinosa TaxID=7769 RepID=UPI00358FDD70